MTCCGSRSRAPESALRKRRKVNWILPSLSLVFFKDTRLEFRRTADWKSAIQQVGKPALRARGRGHLRHD